MIKAKPGSVLPLTACSTRLLGNLTNAAKRSINLALSYRGQCGLEAVGVLDKVMPQTVRMAHRAVHTHGDPIPSLQPYGVGDQAIYSVSRCVRARARELLVRGQQLLLRVIQAQVLGPCSAGSSLFSCYYVNVDHINSFDVVPADFVESWLYFPLSFRSLLNCTLLDGLQEEVAKTGRCEIRTHTHTHAHCSFVCPSTCLPLSISEYTHALMLTQPFAAHRLDIRFNTKLTRISENGEVTLVPTVGQAYTLQTRLVIGADGAFSAVRSAYVAPFH